MVAIVVIKKEDGRTYQKCLECGHENEVYRKG